MSEWQPIKTAPRDRFILLHVPNGRLEVGGDVTIGCYFPDHSEEERDKRGRFLKRHPWWLADWSGFIGIDGDNSPSWCDPTHWMPLPAPPTD